MRKVSMQNWLFVRFCFIIILPGVIIFLFANYLYVTAAMDQQLKSKILLLDEIKHNIDTKLKFIQQMTLQFYLNNEAMEELDKCTEAIDLKAVQTQLDSYVNSSLYVANAYIYSEKGVFTADMAL